MRKYYIREPSIILVNLEYYLVARFLDCTQDSLMRYLSIICNLY